MKKEFKKGPFGLYLGYSQPSLTFCPEFYFDGRAKIIIAFYFFELFITLPFGSGREDSEWRSYGFYFYGEGKRMFDSFWLCFGSKSKCFHMPWSWEWVRTSNLRKDGTWENETRKERKSLYEEKWREVLLYETFPYTYVLKNGTVQERKATIKTEEMEWRWRWFTWSKYPRLIRKSISIEFSDEVGERTGSWKGGTLGCGYELMPNETPLECLRRMEKERKF
jgi:hypothetical protein